MDFDIASQASAIDDSFFPIAPTPAPTGSAILDNNVGGGRWNAGPRPDHWNVASTANGSGIDDQTPTIVGFPAGSNHGAVAGTKRIPPSVLRKLAAATEAERKLRADTLVQEGVENGGHDALEHQKNVKAEKEKQGFYVPRLDNRGIRIQARGGRCEIIKQPMPRSIKPPGPPVMNDETEQPAADEAHAPSRPASVKSEAVASNLNKRNSNRVRIVGKNGEESFVELPSIPRTSKAATAKQTQKETPQAATPNPVPPPVPTPADDVEANNERDQVAEKEAKRLRRERQAAEATAKREAEQRQKEKLAAEAAAAKEVERLRNERLAAEGAAKEEAERVGIETLAAAAMMHGALPPPSRAPSVAKARPQSKGSSKTSDRKVPIVFDTVSKPASIASSTTSFARSASALRPSDLGEGVKKTDDRPSKQSTIAGWQEVGYGSYEPAPSIASRPRQVQATTRSDYKAPRNLASSPVPERRQSSSNHAESHRQPSGSKSVDRRSSYRNQQTSQRGVDKGWQYPAEAFPDNSGGWSQASAASTDSFPVEPVTATSHPYAHLWQQSSGGFGPHIQGPTVFAGRGWISPHPLSEAPTWARQEPDPVIQLPSGAAIRTESGIETMTYEEWLAVQNQTDSQIGSRAASSKVQTVVSSAKNRSERMSGNNEMSGGRRNISITESHASRQYAGGNWALRENVPDRPSNHWTPTVSTESATRRSQQQSLRRSIASGDAGAREVQDEDGNVKLQLQMPLDNPPSRQASDNAQRSQMSGHPQSRQVSVSSSDALFF